MRVNKMIELIKILLPYILGVVCTAIMFQPMKNWQEGYNAAKQFYGDRESGFDRGWETAKKVFKDYEKGFGDGFEAGWITAEEQKKQDEQT